jgi:hypothetical protein
MIHRRQRRFSGGSSLLKGIQPEIVYNMVQPVPFAVMALVVLRMKYLWTPYMCVLASVGLSYYPLHAALWKKFRITTDRVVRNLFFFEYFNLNFIVFQIQLSQHAVLFAVLGLLCFRVSVLRLLFFALLIVSFSLCRKL